QKQAYLPPSRIRCVSTGVDPRQILYRQEEVEAFRKKHGIEKNDLLVGTVCILRSWKGICDLLDAANLLREKTQIKWVIVGGGHLQDYLPKRDALALQKLVIFTGQITPPYAALAALDIFTLLSTAHEGISQASLQASYLEKPLITTPIGGLPEVCLDKKTGLIVPPASPSKVAEAVLHLANSPGLRKTYGQNGKAHVLKHFTMVNTLDQMEEIARFL
ncbi:MAG: glycosyltransferase family 4 protein, partial [Chlamydiales bacterium]|nr:glycosyltransferase family 4 protein [Chlamydiales bacterium]